MEDIKGTEKEVKVDKTKQNKKLIIDLNAEKEIINFEGVLGVEDSLLLLECLNDVTKQMNEHLKKVMMASYINLAGKIKLECELSDNQDGEIKITNDKFVKMVVEIMK